MVLFIHHPMHKDHSIVRRLVAGTQHGLLGSIGGKFLGVLSSILAARLLGPTSFGLYAIGWTLLRFLSLIFPLGMDRALLFFGPQYINKDLGKFKGTITSALIIAIISAIVFGTALFFLSPWLSTSLYQKTELIPVFRLFSFAFPVISLLTVATAASRVSQNMKLSVLIQDLGQPLLCLIFIVIFYLIKLDLNGVIYSEILSFAIAAVIATALLFRIFPSLRKIAANFEISPGRILSYSIPTAFAGAFSVYILWVDRIITGVLQPASENGIYQAASQISTIFMVISAGINLIVVPMFSDLFHKKDLRGVEEIYRISSKWGIYFSAPILIVLLTSPGDSIALLYGESYRGGLAALVILLIGQAINLFTGSINPLLIMAGQEKALFRISGITLVIAVLLNLLLIPTMGIIGAAISTSVCLSVLYLFALLWGKFKLGLWPYDKRIIKGFFAAAGASILVVLIKFAIPFSGVYSILIQAVISMVTFYSLLLLQKLDPEDHLFLSSLISKYSRKR